MSFKTHNEQFTVEYIINENLGNLSPLKGKLLSPFKTYKTLAALFGKDSPVETVEIKKGIEVLKVANSIKGGGFITFNGKPVISFANVSSGSRRGEFYAEMDETVIMKVPPVVFKTSRETIRTSSGTRQIVDTEITPFNMWSGNVDLNPSTIRKFWDHYSKHGTLVFHKIGIDQSRLDLKNSRSKATAGLSQSRSDVARDLRKRLDVFKASKVSDYSTPNDLIGDIIDKGNLEKFKLAGIPYTLTDTRVNRDGFESIKNGAKFGYLEYSIDGSSPVIKAIAGRYKALRKAFFEAGASDAFYELMNTSSFYTSIKIPLVFKGGVIKPSADLDGSTSTMRIPSAFYEGFKSEGIVISEAITATIKTKAGKSVKQKFKDEEALLDYITKNGGKVDSVKEKFAKSKKEDEIEESPEEPRSGNDKKLVKFHKDNTKIVKHPMEESNIVEAKNDLGLSWFAPRATKALKAAKSLDAKSIQKLLKQFKRIKRAPDIRIKHLESNPLVREFSSKTGVMQLFVQCNFENSASPGVLLDYSIDDSQFTNAVVSQDLF